jgi:hypothetical protein
MSRDGELVRVGVIVERTTRAALVPISNDEVTFKIAVEIAKQRSFRAARTAVQPQQQRRATVVAPYREKESRAVDRYVAGLRDWLQRVFGYVCRRALGVGREGVGRTTHTQRKQAEPS